ncbi:MAG: Asp-tRNA(Asn)/Glu-tRNA(Gln) amidotransferase subunit GatA [Patescibacteria group bacterium]
MSLNTLTLQQARTKLDKREITALELTEACLARITQVDADIRACLLVCADEARTAARAADERLRRGEKGGLLGIPYLCKDNIMVKGLATTAASRIIENYLAPYDATVIKKLKQAGAVLLGKTNLDEFAHGASTENSAYGPTHNPRHLSHVPGGSSGGSAAAVAADMCIFAIGSDTGGSIRYPASFCGVFGLKPSYGRVSRFGLLSMTSSTDVIGPLTKTAEDAALVLQVIAGPDEHDATTTPEPVGKYTQAVAAAKDLKGMTIGWPKEYFIKDLDSRVAARVRAAAEKLEAADAKFKEVSLPYTKYGIPVYYIITPSEISSNLARFDGIGWGKAHQEADNLQDFYKYSRGSGFGPEAKRRIMLGTYALSAGYYDAYYKKAQAVRTLIINDFAAAFKEVDLLLTPAAPHPAFKIGEHLDDPLAMYLEDVFMSGASLAGLPAISVPAGLVEHREGTPLPVGAQLIGPRLSEAAVLQAAKILEQAK